MTQDPAAKVLVVDDRPENLVALEAILQGLPVEIVSVTSGEDALKRLLVDDFALILLDAQMPGMDGFETAEHIQRRERTRRIPIVFLTAAAYDAHLAYRGYQAGAVDYLTKPFDPWVLRSKVMVFVDLWTAGATLAARIAECEALRAAVHDARELLDNPWQDPASVLPRVRARLEAVDPSRIY
ncbi:response regulator [Pseudonocardia bannensis]|uniref:Response regulator n=1 Tax=Pseudonocardia bannensis TaxID=630973 RepID=A0A848DDH6_9PSEU|nr:response regulator [Pseudonocardia bannensis]NMH90617.1 response regulator [Pseudonocardia bannensis]